MKNMSRVVVAALPARPSLTRVLRSCLGRVLCVVAIFGALAFSPSPARAAPEPWFVITDKCMELAAVTNSVLCTMCVVMGCAANYPAILNPAGPGQTLNPWQNTPNPEFTQCVEQGTAFCQQMPDPPLTPVPVLPLEFAPNPNANPNPDNTVPLVLTTVLLAGGTAKLGVVLYQSGAAGYIGSAAWTGLTGLTGAATAAAPVAIPLALLGGAVLGGYLLSEGVTALYDGTIVGVDNSVLGQGATATGQCPSGMQPQTGLYGTACVPAVAPTYPACSSFQTCAQMQTCTGPFCPLAPCANPQYIEGAQICMGNSGAVTTANNCRVVCQMTSF